MLMINIQNILKIFVNHKKLNFRFWKKKADFLKILKIKKEINSFFLEIKINNKKLKIFVNSLTKYDIYNKLCALLIVFENNIKSNHLDLLNFLKSPPGRLEKNKLTKFKYIY